MAWAPRVYLDTALVFLRHSSASFPDWVMRCIFGSVRQIARRAASQGERDTCSAVCRLVAAAADTGPIAMRHCCVGVAVEALALAARRASAPAWDAYAAMLRSDQGRGRGAVEATAGAACACIARGKLPAEHPGDAAAIGGLISAKQAKPSVTAQCGAVYLMVTAAWTEPESPREAYGQGVLHQRSLTASIEPVGVVGALQVLHAALNRH